MDVLGEGFAPAKINWTLSILRRRLDGYHEIDTIMQALALGDRIKLSTSDTDSHVLLSGPYTRGVPADSRNLVCRAAERYAQEAGISAAYCIELEKNVPNGAGLGGGSSDAATVLRLLEGRYQALGEEALLHLAATLGADIPFFLSGHAAHCRGIGERVRSIDARAFWLVLAMSGGSASTAAVYGRWYERSRIGHVEAISRQAEMTDRAEKALANGDAKGLSAQIFNELEQAAQSLQSEIAHTLESLRQSDALAVSMTGSGAACFGLFASEEAAKEAAARLLMRFVCVTRTLDCANDV